jgi:hypothetical protein
MKQHFWALLVTSTVVFGAVRTAGADDHRHRGRNDPDDGFLLGGTAALDRDPENPVNTVIRIRTDVAPFFGTVSRRANVPVDRLDNMLELKAWFTAPMSCAGGSPRIQLAIDSDGDGQSDGNAFGYFGPPPNFTACPTETWLYEDLTGAGDVAITAPPLFPSTGRTTPNEELEWDLTQFGGAFYNTWSEVETFFSAMPSHRVCSVALVADTFLPIMSGTSYYDLLSGGRATFTDEDDVVRGFARGCGRRDHGDEHHDGDWDHDHDRDEHDERFRARRRSLGGGN